MNLKLICIFLVTSFFTLHPVNAQEHQDISTTELLSLYFDNVYGSDERLISGRVYYGPARGSIQGHPYYFDESWKQGNIETEDKKFDGLQLKYDICLSQIILRHTSTDNAVYQIGLNSGNIISVKMANSEFIPLPGTGKFTDIPFAEVISKGPVQYLVTKEKSLEIRKGAGSSDYEYKEYMKQYLFNQGTLLQFRSKNTIYRRFPEIKRELKKYARQNNLFFIRRDIYARKKLIDYCNVLLTENNE
ncbi:MAG: hypothetical protein U9N72_09385 [Bacteroidota bacterium]|nr:hypothetical protein [Bacteroidota bacterium]